MNIRPVLAVRDLLHTCSRGAARRTGRAPGLNLLSLLLSLDGDDMQTVLELLGHKDVKTATIYLES